MLRASQKQLTEVIRGYHLSIDERSAKAIREATRACPQPLNLW